MELGFPTPFMELGVPQIIPPPDGAKGTAVFKEREIKKASPVSLIVLFIHGLLSYFIAIWHFVYSFEFTMLLYVGFDSFGLAFSFYIW